MICKSRLINLKSNESQIDVNEEWRVTFIKKIIKIKI